MSVSVSAFVGASVDGFIARPDGRLDWLDAAGDEPHGYEEFIATVDAHVIGRKTYDTVLRFEAWPYGTKPVFVLSGSDLAAPPPGAPVERMEGEPAEILAALGRRGIRHVYVDGGVTIQGFLRAGALDRLIISRVPVLLGAGVPLFGDTHGDIGLKHVATRHYPSGLVQSEYEVG